MNDAVVVLLGAVLAPALLGAGIVRWCGLTWRDGRRVFVAWAYLTGHFVQAWVTAAWLVAGQPVPGAVLPAVAAAAGAGAWAVARARARRRVATAPARRRSEPWLVAATAALVAAFVVDAVHAAALPVLDGDEAHIWAAKARVLFTGGDLGWLQGRFVLHADYPMLDPLAQVLAFASCGETLLWQNRLPLQGFTVALLLLASDVVSRMRPRWLAVIVLLAFATAELWRNGTTLNADVLLASTTLATASAWLRWRATGHVRWLRLASIALAAMLASKNEGLMLAVVMLAALVVASAADAHARRRGPRRGSAPPAPPVPARPFRITAAAWLIVPLATLGADIAVDAAFGLHNDLLGVSPHDGRGTWARFVHFLPERVGPVVAHQAGVLLDGARTGWIAVAALLAPLAAGVRARRFAVVWPWLALVLALVGYAAVFVSTPANHGGVDGPANGLRWHLATAGDRTVLHVLPLALLALATALGRRAPLAVHAPPAAMRISASSGT